MSRWFRFYDEVVDDPKVQRLPAELFRAWVNILCLTSKNGGTLPPAEEIAFKLRMSVAKLGKVLDALNDAGLIDTDETGARPHNWDSRQFKSDVSNERVKRHRERRRNVTSAVTATPPETETETETERKEDTAGAVSPSSSRTASYAFESGVIRLSEKDFNQWRESFSHLDLRAELLALTEWAATQPKWFFAVSGALAKRNREAKAAAERAAKSPEFRWNGIEGVL